VEESTLLQEKHRQGLEPGHIMRHLPGRSKRSIVVRLSRLKLRRAAQEQECDEFADGEVQRIIDMRLKEAKTLSEIASEFKSSTYQIEYLWETRCLRILSEEDISSVRWQTKWTPNELEHLFELHRRGTLCLRDVFLQFPSKTEMAVRGKCAREGLAFVKLPKKEKVRVFRKMKRVQPGTANWKAGAKSLGPQEDATKEFDTADLKAQA